MLIYSKEQINFIENKCEELGFSERRLMENAGSFAANEIHKLITDNDKLISVVCGKGNNGGDGFVIARKLALNGHRVVIILPDGPVLEGVKGEMFKLTQEAGITTIDFRSQPDKCRQAIEQSYIIVDAIYGIGFKGELPSRSDLVCKLINNSNNLVVSIDVPSGIECDTAKISKNAIKSNITISFFGYKSCFVLYPSALMCGEIKISDLGIPEQCKIDSNFRTLNIDNVKLMMPERSEWSHKGTFGKLGAFCGSYGMVGAAVLCAQGAYRSGVGLVKLFIEDKCYSAVSSLLPETVFNIYDDDSSFENIYDELALNDAVVIGCGIEKSNRNQLLLNKLISEYENTLIIDGTALRLLAVDLEKLKDKKANIILTPHDGELAELCGLSLEELNANKLFYANQLARKYAITVVEKGPHTVVHCSNGSMYVNPTGNNGLATAGSGDVLAGTIASLCAQGLSPTDAACVGVFVHGLSADLYSKSNSSRSMIASDICEGYKKAFTIIE